MLDSSCLKQVDEIYSMQTSLMKIFNNFRRRIKIDYVVEKIWNNMLKMFKSLRKRLEKEKNDIIKTSIINNETDNKSPSLATVTEIDQSSSNNNLPPSKKSSVVNKKQFSTNNNLSLFNNIFKKQRKFYIDINFKLTNDNFIYYIKNNVRWLCISTLLKKNIFQLTYNVNVHVDIHRSYNWVMNIVFIFKFFNKLCCYIKHCFNCQLSQTIQHKFYNELMSIISSLQLFYIIIMNFIVDLFDELNVIFTITNKFSRWVIVIIKKNIYLINQWANLLINRLL